MQIGPYTVLEELARGGQGVVYRAQDARGQVVALKLLLAHRAQNRHARQRFQAEVHALARLRHPHVVAILAAGEHEGAPWLALDYVEGESLTERLRRGPLPIHEALRVAQQLAQALSYVHACGVLHRDLKPDNVLLRGNDALLTDFGLVLDQESELSRLTATGVFQGTPGYWAPEQARGETRAHGPATDVYGLGAVLYACLTARGPVEADSLQAFLQTIRFTSVQPPRALRADVPDWLSELCMRCLALEPDARPASADAVARALLLAGSTASLAAGEPASRARRLGLGAGLLLTAGALVAGGLWANRGGGLAAGPAPPAPGASAPSAPASEAPAPAAPVDEVVATLELATEHFDAGRYAEAVHDYGRVLELDPSRALAWLGRGTANANLKRYAEAVADLDRALELDPDHAGAYCNRGTCKTELGRDEEAIADFDRALELDPSRVSVYGLRALAKANLGRHEQAIADCTLALEQGADWAGAYTTRGTSKLRLERYGEAVEDFDRALELDPSRPAAFFHRGVCRARLGRHAEAIEDFDRALELDPGLEPVYYSRGVARMRLRRAEEALADFDRVLELDPDHPRANSYRGTIHTNQGNYAQALADLDRAFAAGAESPGARYNRGLSLFGLDRFAEAIADFDRVLELDPGFVLARVNRGLAKAQLGRYAEALADYDRALALGGLGEQEAAVRELRAEAQSELGD